MQEENTALSNSPLNNTPDNLNERLLESIGFLLNLFVVNEHRFPSAEGRMRYNPIDFQTLRCIDKQPGCSGADIARALGVAPTTSQSVLDRLIKKGWVKRYDQPSSKRAKAHVLTEAGKDLRSAILRQDLTNMEEILGALTPEEQVQTTRLLAKIVSHLEQTSTP